MAKSLAQRLEAAANPRARLADNEALLADLISEKERLEAARDAAATESIDFALSDQDRDEAAAKASRLDRTIRGLETEIANLAVANEERRSSDAAKAAEAEKRAALTERDELAARFAKRVPAITSELIEIFKAVNGNADRMRRAGVHEASAEFHARGIAGNGMIGASPAEPFTKMKIPNFGGAGRAWPVDQMAEISRQAAALSADAIARQRKAAQQERERKEKEAAEHARLHGRYRLISQQVSEPIRIPPELVSGSIPRAIGNWAPFEGEIAHEIADQLKAISGLRVERLDTEAAQ